MRVLGITTSFPRDENDHAGRFVHDLHAGLTELGHDVLTICPSSEGAPECEETEAGRVLRIPYGRPGTMDLFYGDGLETNWRRVRRPVSKLRAFQRAAAAAARARIDEIDLVVAHWIWPCGHSAISAVGDTRVPVIGVGHGGDLHLLGRGLLGRWLGRRLRGRLQGALVTTRAGADVVRQRLGVERVRVAPMGVDPRRFRLRYERPEGWPDPYVLGVGRLVHIKGFDVLLDACARAGVDVVIVGEGPEADALRARGSARDAVFAGRLAPADVAAAMQHARAVVVPSRVGRGGRTEGFPVVVAEALLSGATVIASRTGGMADLLPDELLFPPQDVDALAAKLATACPPGDAARRGLPLERTETARILLSLLDDREADGRADGS